MLVSVFSRQCSAPQDRETAYVVGHGSVGLHDFHNPASLRVSPTPQEFRRGPDRVVLVNVDGVKTSACLGGVSGAVSRASGTASSGGIVRVHAAEALRTWKGRRL